MDHESQCSIYNRFRDYRRLLLMVGSIRVVKQYERGVHFRLGRVIAVREPGLRLIIPVVDRLWRSRCGS